MKKKMIEYEIDLAKPPALTKAQKAEIASVEAKPENEIDYSGIPALEDAFWKNAVRNPFYRPTKTSTTVRIDSDVLHWLRNQGKGYQSRINAILRREMLQSVNANTSSSSP
ncbi:MAG: BrnA antitoxin family protein [Terracidiphilus sp.]